MTSLRSKYAITAWFYDILDYPWERIYRRWRPQLLGKLSGNVLELGVGTGRNLAYYPANCNVLAVDLSPAMLKKAQKRAKKAACHIELREEDATTLVTVPDNSMDHIVATFLCCVMPNELQPQALQQIARVLKPGGEFLLLEIIYSQQARIKRRQQWLAPLVKKIYGARFDRKTLDYIKQIPELELTQTRFLKDDTYLLIQGKRKSCNYD